MLNEQGESKPKLSPIARGGEQMRQVLFLAVLVALLAATFGLSAPAEVAREASSSPIVSLEQARTGASVAWGPFYSPDRKRAVMVYAHGYKPERDHYLVARNAKMYLVVDDVAWEYKEVDVSSISFSPDSRRLAYAAVSITAIAAAERPTKRSVWCVVVEGQEGRVYEEIGPFTPIFSPDSRRVGYTAKRSGKWIAVIDEREGREFDWIAPNSLAFGSDSARVGYWAKRAGRQYAVIDGRENEDGAVPIFSPDGKRVAFVVARGRNKYTGGKNYCLVVDGVEGKEYAGIDYTDSLYCPRGEIRENFERLRDRRPVVAESTFAPRAAYWPPTATLFGLFGNRQALIVSHRSFFSPDSRRVAYVASHCPTYNQFKQLVVLDGAEGSLYDEVSKLTFSPDSRRIAYWAERGKKWRVGLDTQEIGEWDDLPTSLEFTPDSAQLVYETYRGGRNIITLPAAAGVE